MIESAMSVGLSGIQSGVESLNKAADQTAKLNKPENDDYAQARTDELKAETDVKASAKVVEAADETLGTLIDIRV